MTVREKIEAMLAEECRGRILDVATTLFPVIGEDALMLAKRLVRFHKSRPVRLVGDEIVVGDRVDEDATYVYLVDGHVFKKACVYAGCAINF